MKKNIFDPIHGFISLDPWEVDLIKTLPFKRLQAIHQIGSAIYVYGGGNHKRYGHSLGAMFIATKIYDKIAKEASIAKQKQYWRKVIRVAALCHDMGHLPFSHLAEKEILGEKGHEEWTMRLIRSHYLMPIWKQMEVKVEDVVKIAVGEKIYGSSFTSWESVVTEMLTGDFFGADRIDYLLRDSYFTGLAYGSFDYPQLIDSLTLLSDGNKLQVGVTEDGLEACYSLLLARHFMHKRLYQYPNVKSYSFHLRNMVKYFFAGKNYLDSVDTYLTVNDFDILSEINRAYFDKKHKMNKDALALMDQGERVTVQMMTKEEIEGLTVKDVIIEKGPFLSQGKGLDFPVLLKNGTVTSAKDISEVCIPINSKHWVYFINGRKGLQKNSK